MDFNSFGAIGAHFNQVASHIEPAMRRGLAEASKEVVKKAKGKFGHYQPGWAPLKDATQQERVRQGYTPNDPLLRSGELQSLVTAEMDADGNLFVGVPEGARDFDGNDAAEIMAVHEFGSVDGRVPARPVFGIVVNELDDVIDHLAQDVFKTARLEVDG